MKTQPDRSMRNRVRAAYLMVSLVFFALLARLAYIQVIDNEFYRAKAMDVMVKEIPIEPKRGSVYDRNGVKLAFSVANFTVWARPEDVNKSKRIDDTVESLSKVLKIESAEVRKLITNNNKKLVRVARNLPKSEADIIKNKSMRGIWVTDSSKRIYPYNNFASQLLGFTSEEGAGLWGLEYQLDSQMAGTVGKIVTSTDAAGRQLPFSEEKRVEPVQGANVTLTIDEIIQHFTEKAVERGLADFEPKKIMAIVMDPNTGEILSMVNKPDFNPNDPRNLSALATPEQLASMTPEQKSELLIKSWKNSIVTDTYEPGSTLKILTAAAGLEEKVVTPNTKFKDIGYAIVSGVKIHCWDRRNPHGIQTLTEGLENSCNPVFIDISQRLGRDRYYNYLEKFGIVGKTNISLPGESKTLIQKRKGIRPVELATMSIGHGVSTTPLHVITAISAIANGGNLMEPKIYKNFKDEQGTVTKSFEPKVVRRVISENTAEQMRLMMESVVKNGSGKLAYIQGIRIGGKTGTSEKLVNGAYSKSLAYASFIGIAPVDKPKVIVLVVVDEPKDTNFGSKVAAPIAHNILLDTLRYLKVEPNMPQNSKKVTVPNLVGKTFAEATTILEASQLILNSDPLENEDPSAYIKKQYPAAGSKVNANSMVIISSTNE